MTKSITTFPTSTQAEELFIHNLKEKVKDKKLMQLEGGQRRTDLANAVLHLKVLEWFLNKSLTVKNYMAIYPQQVKEKLFHYFLSCFTFS